MDFEEEVTPMEYTDGPFVFCVPSPWVYTHSHDEGSEDFFEHPSGAVVQVTKLIMKKRPEDSVEPPDLRTLVGGDDALEAQGPAVLLTTGLAMVSYSAAVESEPDYIALQCELCGFSSEQRLCVLRYSSTILRSEAGSPEVTFWSHVFRQHARFTSLL